MKSAKIIILLCVVAVIVSLTSCDRKQNGKNEHSQLDGSEGLEYTLSYDGTYYIVRGLGSCTDVDLIIPSTYNNLPVMGIDEMAFLGCTNFTSVTIPDSVTIIGYSAFAKCTNLTNVKVGNGVASIGQSAFSCPNLTSVIIDVNNANYRTIDGNLYKINDDGTTLTLVQYARGKTNTSFVVPKDVTNIGIASLAGCTRLTNIVIPDSVTTISMAAFEGCIGIKTVGPAGSGASIELSNNVKSIDNYAFYECNNLTSVVIPYSVMSIGQEVFYNCTSLTSVIFENTEGWWLGISSTATSGSSISVADLADPTTAANYLKSTYDNYYWFCSKNQ